MNRHLSKSQTKPEWEDIPASVRAATESALGKRIVSGTTAWGGFTPSATVVLALEDGSKAFFKGVSTAHNNGNTQTAIRAEARVYRELPQISPWAPAFSAAFEMDGWYVLLLEAFDNPLHVPPWTPELTASVIKAIADLHSSTRGARLPDWLKLSYSNFLSFDPANKVGWWFVAEDEAVRLGLTSCCGPAQPEALRCLERYSPVLAEFQKDALNYDGPKSILHMDIRSDNIVFRPNGSTILVDWPSACVGPGLHEMSGFSQRLEAEGGPKAEHTLDRYARLTGKPIDRDLLSMVRVGGAGYFASRGGLPEIPGLPMVRTHQRDRLAQGLPLAAQALGLPEPTWVAKLRDPKLH